MTVATAGLTVDIDYIRVWSDDPPDTALTINTSPTLSASYVTPYKIEDSFEFKNAQSIILSL